MNVALDERKLKTTRASIGALSNYNEEKLKFSFDIY